MKPGPPPCGSPHTACVAGPLVLFPLFVPPRLPHVSLPGSPMSPSFPSLSAEATLPPWALQGHFWKADVTLPSPDQGPSELCGVLVWASLSNVLTARCPLHGPSLGRDRPLQQCLQGGRRWCNGREGTGRRAWLLWSPRWLCLAPGSEFVHSQAPSLLWTSSGHGRCVLCKPGMDVGGVETQAGGRAS